MNKFDNDFTANQDKATKLKNDFSMRKTQEAHHQHGTDGDLTQVHFNRHNKIYNWRENPETLNKIKSNLPMNISDLMGERERGNDLIISG